MKKRFAIAVGALALPFAGHAQSSLTVYGLLDISGEYLHFSEVPRHPSSTLVAETSDTSRLGFRGIEDLGDGYRAYFRLENGFNLDTGGFTGNAGLFQRESYAGLGSDRWGSLQLGGQYTPENSISVKIDPFQRFGLGSLTTLLQGIRGYQNRYDNAVQYVSPTIGGALLRVIGSDGEGTGDKVTGSLEYTNGPFYGAVMYDHVKATAATFGIKGGMAQGQTLSVAASWNFDVVRLSGWVQQNRTQTLPDVDAVLVGAVVPLGSGEIRASWSHRSVTGGDASLVAAGYVHFLSKRTQLYASVGKLSNDGTSAIKMGPATTEETAGNVPYPGQDIVGVQLGFRHFF